MIQRIQSLWLALVVVLCVAAFFFPLAIFQFPVKDFTTDAIYKLLPIGTQPYQSDPAWTALIFNCIVLVVGFITIFMYKNRIIQLKILSFAFLACVVEVALLFFYQIDAGLTAAVTSMYKGTPAEIKPTVDAAKTAYGVASYFPIAEVIFFILARNAIRKDEIRVRNSERLR